MGRWLASGAAAISLAAIGTLPASGASAMQTCSDHRAVCQSSCTPRQVARDHFGDVDRCEASCEPRRQQCLRTGVWVDLERRSTGWWEKAIPF